MVMTLDFLYKKYIMTISVSRIINISCIKIGFRTVLYNKAPLLSYMQIHWESQPGPMTNKQVESCFLNHNSSIICCCTDSLLMTHRDGLIWVSLFGEVEGGKFPFVLGQNNFVVPWLYVRVDIILLWTHQLTKRALNYFNPATFYWSACAKTGKWAVVYMCFSVSILPLSVILILDYWTSSMWYFSPFHSINLPNSHVKSFH
jgi:hypothetical protein